jgi:excisionase family DNA binding protein
MKRLLTTAEAARELNVTQRRIQQLIKAGELRAQRFGRDWLIDARDLAKVKRRPRGRPANSL